MRFASTSLTFVFALSLLGPLAARAEDYNLVIKDHRFDPAELTVPANTRIKLTIDNQDVAPEEFDSHDLRVEKVVPGGTQGFVWVGPLPAGEYKFVGEFHEDTAKGKLIAR
ncbi:MAG: cupredoxin domain-containing protein [Arenicellales bacterium]